MDLLKTQRWWENVMTLILHWETKTSFRPMAPVAQKRKERKKKKTLCLAENRIKYSNFRPLFV